MFGILATLRPCSVIVRYDFSLDIIWPNQICCIHQNWKGTFFFEQVWGRCSVVSLKKKYS